MLSERRLRQQIQERILITKTKNNKKKNVDAVKIEVLITRSGFCIYSSEKGSLSKRTLNPTQGLFFVRTLEDLK